MNKTYSLFLIFVLFLSVSACSKETEKRDTILKKDDLSMILDKSDFTMMNWKVDNSHTEHVTGKIVSKDTPIKGVKVQISNKRIMETNDKGEFYFSVNRNILADQNVHVVNVDKATIKGKELDKQTKKILLGLNKRVLVHYPIRVNKVTTNSSNKDLVDVHGTAIVTNGEQFPNFTPDKYKVGGTVKNFDGTPAVGATVNLRRDGVEGFSMSEPSDKDGKYAMYYLPEDDEDHYFYVHYNGKNYTLPPYKVYNFPEDISVNIDITLPKDGTIIVDKPPTLVTTLAKGALYKGTLIGLNLSDDVNYTISIPNRDGSFVITLPKKEWDKKPTFYEIVYSHFLENGHKSGDIISSELIPKPKLNEPNHLMSE